MSVNKAWRGRRFKTDIYKVFEQEVYYSLPPLTIPDGKLEVYYKFGVSNKLSDWDNPIKQFQDVLTKKYGFDDRQIHRGIVEKEVVEKGKEFIEFNISKWNIY